MLGLQLQTLSSPPPPYPIPIPIRCFTPQNHRLSSISARSRNFSVYAADQNNGNRNNPSTGNGNQKINGSGNGNGNGGGDNGDDDEMKKKEKNGAIGFGWGQLQQLLDPDPDNLFAVGLTGLLTWASVQVVWQLVVVAVAIVVAGLKYSLVAALLLFILIALL